MTERAIRRKFELLKKKLEKLEAGMIKQRLEASGASSNSNVTGPMSRRRLPGPA